MSLRAAIEDADIRSKVAAGAVAEAEAAVRERSGLAGVAAQAGLDTINLLRPGFLERHVHAMLPELAAVVDPHWEAGVRAGDPLVFLEAAAPDVTRELLDVADAYVATASDTKAIAIYDHLRPRAQRRIEEQMPRIARFIESHTPHD